MVRIIPRNAEIQGPFGFYYEYKTVLKVSYSAVFDTSTKQGTDCNVYIYAGVLCLMLVAGYSTYVVGCLRLRNSVGVGKKCASVKRQASHPGWVFASRFFGEIVGYYLLG